MGEEEEWRYGSVRSTAAECGRCQFRLTSSCQSKFVEKTEVEEMRERREAVLLLWVRGLTVWLTLLTLG